MSARETLDQFNDGLVRFRADPQDPQLHMGVILAIGYLLGGGLSYGAAGVAVLLEQQGYPGPFPWERL